MLGYFERTESRLSTEPSAETHVPVPVRACNRRLWHVVGVGAMNYGSIVAYSTYISSDEC